MFLLGSRDCNLLEAFCQRPLRTGQTLRGSAGARDRNAGSRHEKTEEGRAKGSSPPGRPRGWGSCRPSHADSSFLGSCFCLGFRPDMRWGWPRAQGPGLCFLQLSAGLMCPSCEGEGGASCRRALSHGGSLSPCR